MGLSQSTRAWWPFDSHIKQTKKASLKKTHQTNPAGVSKRPLGSRFQENEQTEEVGPALGEVEVFMTVAGREGKGYAAAGIALPVA